jgi:hypothetical protein
MVGPKNDRILFVEGGGDKNPSLASECRRAFSKLFERAGIKERPKVVVCGGRRHAYDQFCRALSENKCNVWLLVDAEEGVAAGPPFDPWAHVAARKGDGWARPEGATDEQLQFMNVVMETWLLADQDALRRVFGPKLELHGLPPVGPALETLVKPAVYAALNAAIKPTPSKGYGKGSHSFKVLAEVDPAKLRVLSWANRLLVATGA